jgi:hypothetical protein
MPQLFAEVCRCLEKDCCCLIDTVCIDDILYLCITLENNNAVVVNALLYSYYNGTWHVFLADSIACEANFVFALDGGGEVKLFRHHLRTLSAQARLICSARAGSRADPSVQAAQFLSAWIHASNWFGIYAPTLTLTLVKQSNSQLHDCLRLLSTCWQTRMCSFVWLGHH